MGTPWSTADLGVVDHRREASGICGPARCRKAKRRRRRWATAAAAGRSAAAAARKGAGHVRHLVVVIVVALPPSAAAARPLPRAWVSLFNSSFISSCCGSTCRRRRRRRRRACASVRALVHDSTCCCRCRCRFRRAAASVREHPRCPVHDLLVAVVVRVVKFARRPTPARRPALLHSSTALKACSTALPIFASIGPAAAKASLRPPCLATVRARLILLWRDATPESGGVAGRPERPSVGDDGAMRGRPLRACG